MERQSKLALTRTAGTEGSDDGLFNGRVGAGAGA